MNYYKLYKRLRLDELGISSDEEAEELEFELELRFEEFTPKDRKTWLDQNAYLEHFSRTGTVTSAARRAGVTVYKAQRWKYDNVLGFTRRLEVATLVFKDRLKQKVLLRASDPKAPATLLIELLRAYIPEEFSRNGHKCDTSKADELLPPLPRGRPPRTGGRPPNPPQNRRRRYQRTAQRRPRAFNSNLSPTPGDPHNSNLSPAGGEIQRGGALHTDPHAHQPSPDASEVSQHEPTSPTRHSRVGTGIHKRSLQAQLGQAKPQTSPRRPTHTKAPITTTTHPSHGRPTHLSPAAGDPHNTNLSPAGGEIQRGGSSRAQRREQLRQQRKQEKKNTFPVVRF